MHAQMDFGNCYSFFTRFGERGLAHTSYSVYLEDHNFGFKTLANLKFCLYPFSYNYCMLVHTRTFYEWCIILHICDLKFTYHFLQQNDTNNTVVLTYFQKYDVRMPKNYILQDCLMQLYCYHTFYLCCKV